MCCILGKLWVGRPIEIVKYLSEVLLTFLTSVDLKLSIVIVESLLEMGRP